MTKVLQKDSTLTAKQVAAAVTRKVNVVDKSGKIVMDEFRWPAAGQSVLRAVDMSKFHGNYCLSIGDTAVSNSIEARRKENNPDPKKGNTIVDSVTKGGTVEGDANENVLGDILGGDKK